MSRGIYSFVSSRRHLGMKNHVLLTADSIYVVFLPSEIHDLSGEL